MPTNTTRQKLSAVLQDHGVADPALLEALVAASQAEEPGPEDGQTTDVKTISGSRLTWDTAAGTFQFSGVPATLMWVDSTLAGMWSGMREMVGPRRFGLALHKQGRNSVEDDWGIIGMGETFEEGFALLAEVAAAAGWGRWRILELDYASSTLVIQASDCWEQALASKHSDLSIHFLSGKFSGYGTRLFGQNCWTIAEEVPGSGGQAHVCRVRPSTRSLEGELDHLLSSDEATRADLAVAVHRLKREVREHLQTSRDLKAAKETAEHATHAKTRFLANMSHEIRTPMHGILGSLELLCSTGLAPQQSELASSALSSAQSLLSLIGDILDISRIEADRLELEEKPFQLREVIQGVLDMMRPLCLTRNLTLTATTAPDVPRWLLGDQGRVRQILVNLLGNALKFTLEGSITVETTSAGEHVQIDVRDTGIGIPGDKLSSIFNPFQQADSSTSRRFGGTGLGLSISRLLTEHMGGSLSVQSTPGVGSVFSLHLRLPEVVPVQVRPEPHEGPLPSRFTARVLVVDDSSVNRRIAELMLMTIGCTVDLAENGAQALQRMAHRSYDLVLMDVMMPVMDGLVTTRKWRHLEGAESHAIIIAMTANAMAGDQEICLSAGMDGYLSKPVQRESFQRTLARWAPHSIVTPASAPGASGTQRASDG